MWRRINGKPIWIEARPYGRTNKNPSYNCPYCKKVVKNDHNFAKCNSTHGGRK